MHILPPEIEEHEDTNMEYKRNRVAAHSSLDSRGSIRKRTAEERGMGAQLFDVVTGAKGDRKTMLGNGIPPPPPLAALKHTSILKPGAQFTGYQESGRQQYQVQVKLLEVDAGQSTLSGLLTIHGLTESYPVITTYFEGEMVGPKYSFETKHDSWGSSPRNDVQHWARFKPWRDLGIQLQHDAMNHLYYQAHAQQGEYLYMRWKEMFLYPNSHITNIKGASFAGFYYICFNRVTGNVVGLYYHKYTDRFQQLNLSFVPDSGVCGTYEYS